MSSLALGLALCAAPVVHDGDTIRCGSERIRLASIDAPELRGSPSCRGRKALTRWCGDYRLAEQSRDTLRAFLASGPVMVERIGRDFYGRTVAVVRVRGVDAGERMVRAGLARRWR